MSLLWRRLQRSSPIGSAGRRATCHVPKDSARGLGRARTIRQLSLNFEQGGRYTHAQLELPILVHVAQTTWPHDGFEALVDEVARDALRLAWFSEASGEVFAPYDGGIDLIVDSPSRAQALRRRLPRDWFSTHASGL